MRGVSRVAWLLFLGLWAGCTGEPGAVSPSGSSSPGAQAPLSTSTAPASLASKLRSAESSLPKQAASSGSASPKQPPGPKHPEPSASESPLPDTSQPQEESPGEVKWKVVQESRWGRTLWPQGRKPPQGDLRTRRTGIDWPDFLGPHRDNKSPERGLPQRWSAKGPPVVWTCPVGAGYPAPTVAQGRIYIFSQYGTTVRLSCRKSETGQELWRFEYTSHYEDMYGYDNGPRCAPVVDEDRVYILGAEGVLHCLDAQTGRMIWRLDTVKRFGVVQNFFGVGSTPVVEGDLLLVQVGGSPPGDQQVPLGRLDLVKPNGTAVVALDKHTGQVRWAAGEELASYASPVVRTLGGRRWCFLFARGGLLVLNPNTGKIWFHFPWRAPILESVNAANPVIVGSEVFLSETYGPGSVLLRLHEQGPEVVWSDENRRRDKAMQCHWATPIYHEGYLYGCSGRHTHTAELRCIEWKTGRLMWRQPNTTRCSLLYVDGHLVVLGEYGDLMLVRATPKRFEQVAHWVLKDPQNPQRPLLRYPAWASPVLSHGLLYLRAAGRVACVELIPAGSGLPPARSAQPPPSSPNP